ncbi:MAG: efflux RND transporter permease subunit, partial [Betaproteobacteria bacterium]|nr:efflux RND transporter permease subunit [Betaproteobacteria bacterium]
LNIEAYPNPAPVIIEITAQAPGLSAEDMERYYTVPMEIGLASTPGVDVIRSTSFYGLSFVRVMFQYGVDYFFAYTQAVNSLQQNLNLPNNVQPTIQGSSLVGEIYRYELVAPPHFGLTNLRTIQDWVVQRRLLTIPGVVQVVTWGGTTKAYNVEVDLHKLDGYNITLPQVLTAIGNANINVGGRTINVGQQSVNIRGVGLIRNIEDIENIVLNAQAGGVPVMVKDVGNVSLGFLPRLGKAGRDEDDDVVTGIVIMRRTEQTKVMVERVKAAIEKLNGDGTLPAGVKLVPFYDRSTLVHVTTHTVLHNLVFGIVLVFLIQWIFLGDLRSAIIVGANIPFALLFSVIILYLRGESANLLSVGAVDFGIIVDSCVILVENVFRNLQSRPQEQAQLLQAYLVREQDRGWNERLRMIFASSLQVNRAVLFSTLITVAAFVPLFTMQGVEGQIFNPMARTYAYALAGALLATFTVTPALASFLLPAQVRETETFIVRRLRAAYEPLLRWVLSHRRITVAAGAGFVALAAVAAIRLGGEFLPTLEEGNLWIRATMPPTISLEAGEPFVERMRQILRQHPEVITVVSQHGRPDDGSDAAGFYNAELFAPLKPMSEWPRGSTKEKLIGDIQKEFSDEFTGITFNFSQYIQDNVQEQLSGVKGANSVKIIGPDLATLEHLANEVLAIMDDVPGVADLGVFRVLGQPNLNVSVDRARAARYGLNAGDINNVIQTALGGTEATVVLDGERRFSLVVRVAAQYRDRLEAVRNIRVGYQTASGGNAYIPLAELATISLDTGASYIYRELNQRYIPIKFSTRGRDLASTVADAQSRIEQKVKLPQGYRIEWSGEFGALQQAIKRLEIIVPVTLLIIMLLLYGLFNSVLDSLLALTGIPFAIAGGLLTLYATGLDFSISAAIGFVSLFGISVMNGILLVTYYNEVRGWGGRNPTEAMYHAASQRMRPMLMTALSACIGLLPAAISTGIGAQVQRPLATVVVGGLFIGPIMLLLVVPALCLMFLRRRSVEEARDAANSEGMQ